MSSYWSICSEHSELRRTSAKVDLDLWMLSRFCDIEETTEWVVERFSRNICLSIRNEATGRKLHLDFWYDEVIEEMQEKLAGSMIFFFVDVQKSYLMTVIVRQLDKDNSYLPSWLAWPSWAKSTHIALARLFVLRLRYKTSSRCFSLIPQRIC